ncbi:MAG TPA: S41 family peptidase [Planctomycetaceae bacterium]|nr:S41 family peptidase [Planctomycetaceae bacterium]
MSVSQRRGVWIGGLLTAAVLVSRYSPAQSAEKVGAGKAVETRNVAANGDPRKHIEDVATRIFAITDLVLDQHPEPTTRQEMILAGLRSATGPKNLAAPNLGRRVSDLKTKEDLATLLNELWPPIMRPTATDSNRFEKALFEGLLRPVPGNAYLLPAKEARVQAQLQANRYIGIGIALGTEDKTQLPQIKMVQPGGPAGLGGVRVGDLIEEINHVRVAPKTPIAETVDQLRGPEGSELTIRVRQPNSKESRTLALVRLPVMFKSVKCSAEKADEDRVVLLNTKPAIAYLKIDSIMASTARELASWEPRLREAGVQALILDLRGTGGATRGGFDSYHSALLVADSLLDGKPLGTLRTRDGARKFTADRECLFRDMPLAVLIDANTNGPAQWVAAALQDAQPVKQKRRRAVIVGDHVLGEPDNFVRSAFPLPGDESLILATAAWERPNQPAARVFDDPEWYVTADVTYDGAPPGPITMAAPMAQSEKSAANAPKLAASHTRRRASMDQAAYEGLQKEIDGQYKQAAIAALRQQLELAAQGGQVSRADQ